MPGGPAESFDGLEQLRALHVSQHPNRMVASDGWMDVCTPDRCTVPIYLAIVLHAALGETFDRLRPWGLGLRVHVSCGELSGRSRSSLALSWPRRLLTAGGTARTFPKCKFIVDY